jgi:hypothetical protein
VFWREFSGTTHLEFCNTIGQEPTWLRTFSLPIAAWSGIARSRPKSDLAPLAQPLVLLEMPADECELRTELARLPPRHAAADAKGLGFVRAFYLFTCQAGGRRGVYLLDLVVLRNSGTILLPEEAGPC